MISWWWLVLIVSICFYFVSNTTSKYLQCASKLLQGTLKPDSIWFPWIFKWFSIYFQSASFQKKTEGNLKTIWKNKKFACMSWYGRVAFHMMLAPPMKMVTGRKLLAGNCVFVPQKAPADLTPLLVDWRRRWRRTGHGRPENWPESGDRPQSRKCCRVRQCVASRKNCCKWI